MHKDKNLENSKCDVSEKLLTLDEAIEHAQSCVDDTPCGQNHRQLAEWLMELDRLKTTPIGNIYLMRQTLVKAHTMLKVCDWPEGVDMKGVADLMKEIESAIDAPARNCDVGTSDEQAERFENFCIEHIGCAEETGGRHCVGCPLENASRNITQKCELYWAQMPYTEGDAQ